MQYVAPVTKSSRDVRRLARRRQADTDALDAAMVRMYVDDGATLRDIAEAAEMSHTAVSRVLRNAGVLRPVGRPAKSAD